jgi:hypothetical protein
LLCGNNYYLKFKIQFSMATFSKGILGGFSGTVGTVIGGNWKGIDYMRSQASKRSGNFTLAQLEQQIKFRLVIAFLETMTGLVRISFKDYAVKMTGFNNAMGYNLKNGITGVYPNFSIDYSMALISRGSLPNATAPSAVVSGNNIHFTWTDNSGIADAAPTDQAILVVYCEALKTAIYTTTGGDRSSGSGSLNVTNFSGQIVETYIGFISTDGKMIASSIYTGELTV